MSRETFGTLLQTSQDLSIDPTTTTTTSLSTTENFLKGQINNTVMFLTDKLRNYKTQPTPRSFTSTAGNIYHHNPPGLVNLVSVTVTVGNITYPLRPVHSQHQWNQFQEFDVASSTVPKYYFPRKDDFGIYPTLQDAYTVTVVGDYEPLRMVAADETTGTISINQNSRTVTGSGTLFTDAMANRFIRPTTNGRWYKIASIESGTSLTLQTFYEEVSIAGETYTIGESPELPTEMHEYIPFRAAAIYYAGPRRDTVTAQRYMNYFYTGDFENPKRYGKAEGGILSVISKYKNNGRAGDGFVYMNQSKNDLWHPLDEAWGVTLS